MRADPEPRAGRPGTSLPRGVAWGPASPRPPAGGRGARHVVERYRQAAGPAVRGIAGVVAAVAFFAAAGVVGGRAGVAIASVWVAVAGTYGLEHLVAARTGRRALPGREGEYAQDH